MIKDEREFLRGGGFLDLGCCAVTLLVIYESISIHLISSSVIACRAVRIVGQMSGVVDLNKFCLTT